MNRLSRQRLVVDDEGSNAGHASGCAPVEGNDDTHRRPAGGGAPELDPVLVAVKLLEPGFRVGQSDAGAPQSLGKAGSGVLDFEHQVAAVSRRADVDPAGATLRVDSVLDGVLDDRLEDHRRY